MAYFYWCIFTLILIHYFIYPVAVNICARLKRENYIAPEINAIPYINLPTITFVIAAYNEEAVIAEKLENTIELDYPKEKIEIIVASHGSTDSTHNIVSGYSENNIMSLHSSNREGKSAALNYAVENASNEIIVFSDANNMFSKDALLYLARHFQRNDIGGVCGRKSITESNDRQAAKGDGLYWKYESAIKNSEGICKTITSADGEIFAMRKALYKPIGKEIINDDLKITFDIIQAGSCVIYEDKALSSEAASISLIDDYYVKVRMVAGGFQFINCNINALLKNPLSFLIMFFIHKVLRWVMPGLLILLVILSIPLLEDPVIGSLFFLQLLFYMLALIGLIFIKQVHKIQLLYIPTYFCLMNAAALHGLFRYLLKSQSVSWRRAKRT